MTLKFHLSGCNKDNTLDEGGNKMIICPECKKELSDGMTACDACGAKLTDTPQTSSAPQFTYIKLSKKAINIIGVLVAVLLVAVFILPKLFGGAEGGSLFIKDNKLYLVDPQSGATTVINDSVVDREEEVTNKTFYSGDVGELLGACLSPDGEALFYLADFVEADGCGYNGTLYMRSMKNPDKDSVKIDSEVRGFSLGSDGKLLTYSKGDHHETTLWRYDFEDKEMVVPANRYKISKDKRIVFYTSGGSLYVDQYGKGKQEIDQGASIYYGSYGDDAVVYQKDGNVYKYTVGGKVEKLAEDVETLLRVYDDGKLYYTRKSDESNTVKGIEFLKDDLREEDASLVQPIAPVEPSRADYESDEEYQIAYNLYEQKHAKYKIALKEYRKKELRDQAREEVAALTLSLEREVYALYYYDGKTETKLTDHCTSGQYVDGSYEYPCIFFKVNAVDAVSKTKVTISNVQNLSQLSYTVEKLMQNHIAVLDGNNTGTEYAAVGASMYELGDCNVSDYVVTEDGKNVYFLAAKAGSSVGTLYTMSLTGDAKAQPSVYETFVYSEIAACGNDCVYMKDVSNDVGTLYVGEKEIEKGVYKRNLRTTEDGAFLYAADFRFSKEERGYTLKKYQDGKATKIAEDVFGFSISNDGSILLLADFDQEDFAGDLYICSDGKKEKIAEDVCTFVPVLQG